MYIGTKDAVEIYAKACRARYGALARRLVTEQRQDLKRNAVGVVPGGGLRDFVDNKKSSSRTITEISP